MGLTFDEKSHRYRLDGKTVRSVTGLLSDGLPKDISRWAARTVAERVADDPDTWERLSELGREPFIAALAATPFQVRNEAATRGTDVHAIAEDIIHGREVEVPARLEGYVTGYVQWLDEFGVEPVLVERRVANRKHWYAGTMDGIVTLGSGETLLVDLKTSGRIYGSHAVQLAAYEQCEFYEDDDGAEHPMPAVDGLAVIHVTPLGTDMFRVTDVPLVREVWWNVLAVAKAKRAIEAVFGDAEVA